MRHVSQARRCLTDLGISQLSPGNRSLDGRGFGYGHRVFAVTYRAATVRDGYRKLTPPNATIVDIPVGLL
jgi:hypothetical protein